MRPGLVAIRNNNISTTTCELLRSPHAIVATTKTVVSSCSRNFTIKQKKRTIRLFILNRVRGKISLL